MAHNWDGSNKLRSLIKPIAQGSLNSPWLSPFATGGVHGNANRSVFLFWFDQLTTGQTVAVQLWQAKDATGTDARVITEAAFVVDETNDGAWKSIEIAPGAFIDAQGYKYVQARVVFSRGTAVWGLSVVNHELRNPGEYGQDETYNEQVAVFVAY